MSEMLFKRIKDWLVTITSFRSGDVIPVDGPLGTAKMSKDDLLKETAQNALGSIHSLTDTATEANLVSGNYLAIDTSAGAKKLPSDFLVKRSEQERNVRMSISYNDKMRYLQRGYVIYTNVAVGTVVNVESLVSSSGWGCVVADVNEDDFVIVKGVGGSASRLWAFLDSSNKLISNSAASLNQSAELLLQAPENGKLVCNFNLVGVSIEPECLVSVSQRVKDHDISNEILNVRKITSLYDNIVGTLVKGYAIATNGAVGSVVNVSSPVSNATLGYIVSDVKEGQLVLVKGKGGSTYRLWAFVDSSNKLLSSSASSLNQTTELILRAPADGKLVCNFNVTDSNTPECKIETLSREKISKIEDDVYQNKLLAAAYDSKFDEIVSDYTIHTNVSVGDVVDISSPSSSAGWGYVVADVKQGDFIIVKGVGGSASRLWAFLDSSNKLISNSAASLNQSTELLLQAPANGKLVCNFNLVGVSIEPECLVSVSVRKKFDEVEERIGSEEYSISKIISGLGSGANVQFDYGYEMFEDPDAVGLVDFGTKSTVMFDIYDALDDIVAANPDLITKVDALDYCGLEYPAYANGISGSSTYEDTPAYKTYMYIIKDENVGAGNTNGVNTKKKLLLYGGTHGSEYAGQFGVFLFVKNLLSLKTADHFKLLSAFDIYVIPVLNGYGSIHEQRPNADWIDINRNFPYPGFTPSGAETIGNKSSCVYSGETPASAIECQLIIKLCETIHFDVVCDHHSYQINLSGETWTQFYVGTARNNTTRMMYKSLADCSFAFKKKYPEYFGSGFSLVMNTTSSSGAPSSVAAGNGTMKRWSLNNTEYVREAIVIEIAQSISYEDGEKASSIINQYGVKTFAVGEYTLRNVLCRMCEYVLKE